MEPTTPTANFSHTTVAKIITIIFLITAIYFGLTQAPAENLTSDIQPPTSNFSDWQTYRNEEYGFEFRYQSDTDSGVSVSKNDGSNRPIRTIQEQLTIDMSGTDENDSVVFIELEGITAVKSVFRTSTQSAPFDRIYFVKDGVGYYIEVYPHIVGNIPTNQILSTFRFLDDEITVLSPNGGEELLRGQEYVIRWESDYPETDTVSIFLVSSKCLEDSCIDAIEYNQHWPDANVIVREFEQQNTGSYVWKVPELNTFFYQANFESAENIAKYKEASPDEYKIVVMRNYEVKSGRVYDLSDSFFTVKN